MRVLRWASLVFLLSGMGVSLAAPARRRPVPPNIVLITMDTTRADRMGFLGSGLGLTPNLDILAKQSVVFTRAYSQVPLTTPSHAVILTGTYPQFNHVRELDAPLSSKLPYLPDILRRNGYRTGAMLASMVLDPNPMPRDSTEAFRPTTPGFTRR